MFESDQKRGWCFWHGQLKENVDVVGGMNQEECLGVVYKGLKTIIPVY